MQPVQQPAIPGPPRWLLGCSEPAAETAGTGSQNPHSTHGREVLNSESLVLGARQLCASTLQVGQAANDIAISSAFSSVLRRGRPDTILAASTTGTS